MWSNLGAVGPLGDAKKRKCEFIVQEIKVLQWQFKSHNILCGQYNKNINFVDATTCLRFHHQLPKIQEKTNGYN